MKMLLLALLMPAALFASGDINFSTPCNLQSDQAVLSFVGDILIHKPMYLSVVNGKGRFLSLWEKTLPLLLKADFSVGNVEGPVAMGIDHTGRDHGDIGFIYDDFIYSGTNLVFNYHPRLLSDLQDSGFNLITGANNHAMDRTSVGVTKTIAAARKLGIKMTGIKKIQESISSFVSIATIKNIRTAFIGCTEVLNEQDPSGQVLLCEGKDIIALIRSLVINNNIDAIIVLPHWGVEYSSEPKDYQRDYAHRFLEAGAIAVIGSHPHVLAPWEKYVTKNKEKKEGLIFYSLGNFVAAQEKLETQTGAVLYLGLTKNKNEKAKIFASAYAPTYRNGLSILPLEVNDRKDLQKNLESFYGSKKRIQLQDSLLKKMCQ